MQTSYRDFAPRLGISYSPDSKTVVRAGYGIFYNQDIGNAVFDMARNIAARVTITSQNGGTGRQTCFTAMRFPAAAAQWPRSRRLTLMWTPTTIVLRTPCSICLNIQRQFGRASLLEAGYLGGQSHHLYGFQDANQGIPGISAVAQYSRYHTPSVSNYGVIQLVADGANASYNSLSVKATRRFSQGSA